MVGLQKSQEQSPGVPDPVGLLEPPDCKKYLYPLEAAAVCFPIQLPQSSSAVKSLKTCWHAAGEENGQPSYQTHKQKVSVLPEPF